MLIKAKNTWGQPTGIEAQRSDLWVLDLEQVASAVRRNDAFFRLPIPDIGKSVFYARSIAMPEQSIRMVEVKSFNSPKLYPGYDDAVGAVRVDFMLDAAITRMNAGTGQLDVEDLSRSEIYSLIYAWRVLTRVGRKPFSTESLSIPLLPTRGAPVGPLGQTFKFDVRLYLLRGRVESINASGETDGELQVSSAYTLKRCWPSTLQLNGLDQSSTNTPVTLSVALVPEEISPYSTEGTIDSRPPGQFTPILQNVGGLA